MWEKDPNKQFDSEPTMRNIKVVLLELLLIVIPFSYHLVFEIIKIIRFDVFRLASQWKPG